jgi:hypothetical protein
MDTYLISDVARRACIPRYLVCFLLPNLVNLCRNTGLEEYSHNPRRTALNSKPLGITLERRVCLAFVVIVPHIVEAGELGLAHYGPALCAGIFHDEAGVKREDIGFAVLPQMLVNWRPSL